MNLRLLLIAPALLLLSAACGDGPDKPSATPTASGRSTPGASPSGSTPTGATPELGPAPVFGDYILKVTPAHGAQVKAANFRTGDPLAGVCFDVSFEKTPEYAQWFRMAFDGKEVTTELTWVLPTKDAPTKGKACYAPNSGLSAGRHEAAVSVQNPKTLSQAPVQTVGWRFDVLP